MGRYFHDARVSDPTLRLQQVSRPSSPPPSTLSRTGRRTGFIAERKLSGDDADAVRLQLRQEMTKPKLAAFAWLETEARSVLPKSPIAQAIAYSQRGATKAA